MDSKIYLIIIPLIIVYVFFTTKVQIKIIKTSYFNKKQKSLNSLFIWIIPFLWGYIVKAVLNRDIPGNY